MTMTNDVTQLLLDWSNGDQQALAKLMPLVYDELRAIAARYLRRQPSGYTIQTTALVHEAYLRLIDQKNVDWQNRNHFFGVSAQLMRHILVNYAKAQQTVKRGGGRYRVSLNDANAVAKEEHLDLVALDDALNLLAQTDARKSRLVELRFFAGLSIEETAEVLAVSLSTAKRDWRLAKAWLYRELARDLTHEFSSENSHLLDKE